MLLGNSFRGKWPKIALIVLIVVAGAGAYILYQNGRFSASADAVRKGGGGLALSPDITIHTDKWSKGIAATGFININEGQKSEWVWLISSKPFTYSVSTSSSRVAEIVNKSDSNETWSGNQKDGYYAHYNAVFRIKGNKGGGATVTVKSGSFSKAISVNVQGDDED